MIWFMCHRTTDCRRYMLCCERWWFESSFKL